MQCKFHQNANCASKISSTTYCSVHVWIQGNGEIAMNLIHHSAFKFPAILREQVTPVLTTVH